MVCLILGYLRYHNFAFTFMIKTILRDLFSFIKKPDDTQSRLTVKSKFLYILILLVFEFILSYLFIFPVLEEIDSILNLRSVDNEYYTALKSVILFVIVVPFGEELLFRYFLRYKGLKTKVISAAAWSRFFPFLVYSFAICFGFMHIANYTNSSNLFYALSPLIILTQLTGGLVITFIRVRLNFIWGFLYHALWNFMVMIAIPAVEVSFTEPYTEHTKNYTIAIEEKLFFDNDKEQSIKIDSTGGKIHGITVKQYYLQTLLDTLYTKDKYYGGEALINLNLTSKDGITKEGIINILKKEYEIE